jgi:hypothetical protein
MSPIEMIPTVVARMLGNKVYTVEVVLRRRLGVYVVRDLAEHANGVLSGLCWRHPHPDSHQHRAIVSIEPISSVCIKAESVRGSFVSYGQVPEQIN